MIRRLVWLLFGVALGVFIMRKLGQIARAYSPSGLAGRAQGGWANFRDGLKAFGREVLTLSREREQELWAALAAENPTPLPRAGTGRHRSAGARGRRGEDDPDSPDARPTSRHGD